MSNEKDKKDLAYNAGSIFATTLMICGAITVLAVTVKIITWLF